MRRRRSGLEWVILGAGLALCAACVSKDEAPRFETASAAVSVPSGFVDEVFVSGLSGPTLMEFAPDGRLFVSQQAGQLRVIKNRTLLAAPFVSLTVDNAGERGLLGVTFDPSFASNQYVYVYYTTPSGGTHNRLSRFTASGDVAVAGSEVVLMDFEPLSSATNHNGGSVHFGKDGKLYVSVGENANGNNAQTLNNRLGKMIRLNSDGSIPTDNPFFGTATGLNRSIWAMGLRNPFTFAVQPGSGKIFINDVGQLTWEEIDLGVAGANYGWPHGEGASGNAPGDTAPLFAYGHVNGQCSIVGGAFHNPATVQFPATWLGHYFFADYCAGWIHRFDPGTATTMDFATGLQSPVDLKVGADGALYYLARGNNIVGRIRAATAQPPRIDVPPTSQTVAAEQAATFTVSASGSPTLTYQWLRNDTSIAGATSASYVLSTAAASDSGAQFKVVVSNGFGTATSQAATLTVTSNQPPMAMITAPSDQALYQAGQTISFAGTATDDKDGVLPASAFTWEVVFHHDTHTHPFMAPTSGIKSGSFVVPAMGETATGVWYRIHLTVVDSAGLTATTFVDIRPTVVNLNLATSPAGLQVTVDGQPVATPATIASVVGMTRTLGAVSQSSGGNSYQFSAWSDGGGATHAIATPAAATSYLATYVVGVGGLLGEYFDNADLTGLTLTRNDASINFDWGTGSPDPSIGSDTFSVRWTGQVTAAFTETYTFYALTNDGVRLWVDGRQVINNWVNQAATEKAATVALVAGQPADLRMETYEDVNVAVAKLSWSSAHTPKQIVPPSQLGPPVSKTFIAKINFQAAGAPVPAGYLPDSGDVFGARNGLSYGWNKLHSDFARDRNINPDQRLDTLCQFHQGGQWEIDLPGGTYNVLVSIGDPLVASTHTLNVEGVSYWNAIALTSNQFRSMTRSITVADGKLTLDQGAAADLATRINYLEI